MYWPSRPAYCNCFREEPYERSTLHWCTGRSMKHLASNREPKACFSNRCLRVCVETGGPKTWVASFWFRFSTSPFCGGVGSWGWPSVSHVQPQNSLALPFSFPLTNTLFPMKWVWGLFQRKVWPFFSLGSFGCKQGK